MSIRWRLTLWFSLILLVILVLSGLALNALLQHYLLDETDNTLKAYSARTHGTVNMESILGPINYSMIHSQLPPLNEFASPGIYIEIVDATGNVTVKSDNLGSQDLPLNLALIDKAIKGGSDIQTEPAGSGANVRIMVSPLHFQDQTLVLAVAQSLQPIDSTMVQLRWALAGGSLLALLMTVLLGALLVRRTLAPVDKITRTAREIENRSDLTRRVDYKGPSDEIGQLATTFDHMIDRLGKTFESQKRFVADASHELRTPLTVIQGNLDLLKRDMGEENRQESLRAIDAEIKRMTNVVSDLLLLAEVEAGQGQKTENVPLKVIVTGEAKRAQNLAGRRNIVFVQIEDLYVKGDPYRLKQLMSNLLDNAIKYTPDEGTISLSLRREGAFARLDVEDHGEGIAPENLPNLFCRFYRVNNSLSRAKGGTGLGLAIVNEIAKQHRGKVSVASQSGKGSTFSVWLRL